MVQDIRISVKFKQEDMDLNKFAPQQPVLSAVNQAVNSGPLLTAPATV